MIAPMKKVWLVVLDRERRRALVDLKRLGVVHVDRMQGSGLDHEHLAKHLGEVGKAAGFLSGVRVKRSGDSGRFDRGEAESVVAEALELVERTRRLHEEAAFLAKECERSAPWGDFDPERIGALGNEGIGLRFFSCPLRKTALLPGDLRMIRLTQGRDVLRFAVPGAVGELPPEILEFHPPALPPAAMRERIARIRDELDRGETQAAGLALRLPAVERLRDILLDELRFETVRSGMEAKGDVAWLSGYVPAADVPGLRAEAARRGWAMAADDPSTGETPPTKIENPGFVRMIDPLFAFLGTVPNYREYDISAWFLGFFSLYFAMIFGDGGYGVILLALAAIMILKGTGGRKKIPDAMRLLVLLGSSTVAWGAVTGTWFAIPFDRLPGILRALAIPAISAADPDADTNIKIFCFVVGAIQLAIAHVKNILRDYPHPKFLAQAGSLAMVVGMFFAVLNLVIDPLRFPLPGWALGLIGGGFLLVFVFGNWDGNLGRSLLEGVKGLIPTFLGTVSVFADIVSYIRLWAVGLAGLAISQTVNGMAAGLLSGTAGRVFAFLAGGLAGMALLFVGHTLNLFMSVLSVVVHGVRLNMLEFSGHLGMEWSGYAYDPLRDAPRDDGATDKKEKKS